MKGRDWEYKALLAVLALGACLFLLSFLLPPPEVKYPEWSRPQGYAEDFPDLGTARVVPLAGPSLRNPVAGAPQGSAILPRRRE